MTYNPNKVREVLNGITPEEEFDDDDDSVFYRRQAKEMLLERNRPKRPSALREANEPRRDEQGRFVKGTSGNRLGRRPKSPYAKSELAMFVNTLVDVTRNGKTEAMTRKLAFMEKVYSEAMNGRVTAIRLFQEWVVQEREERMQAMDMLRSLMARHDGPNGDVWSAQELRLRDELITALSLGMDSTSRWRNMDHARSARRRRLKEGKAAEADAAAMEEKWEAKRAARRARDAARRAAKKSGGSDGGEA